ncbi:hypothetical protein DFJ74DRAFT_772442 [Hyaloraphidium curvatum]|nr:hypothetical protein DFJ74DRAFT_772442 [Hyaloraphidium curvatum]
MPPRTSLHSRPHVRAPTAAYLRTWLRANHATSSGAWIVYPLKGTAEDAPAWSDIVDELLSFGWIDSTAGKAEGGWKKLWACPRRAGSPWSKINRAKIAKLEEDGKMEEPGLEAVRRAREDGSWDRLASAWDGTVPGELERAFARYPGSREQFEGFPPGAKRILLERIAEAKRDETKERRADAIAEAAARGERWGFGGGKG